MLLFPQLFSVKRQFFSVGTVKFELLICVRVLWEVIKGYSNLREVLEFHDCGRDNWHLLKEDLKSANSMIQVDLNKMYVKV